MANENDVVRLKHLQPLVSGVANDFSVQNGDNAVRLKHLVSLASALDNDKQTPVLSLGSWSAVDTVYSAPITYTGDGTLATDIGTIANDILTVEDADGNFSGVISASAGASFAATELNFNYNTRFIKHTPTLSLGEFSQDGTTYTAAITYNGDGTLSTNIGTIANDILTVEDAGGAFSGTISASEGVIYSAATCTFSHVGKQIPNLTIGYFKKYLDSLRAPITYDGDGTLSTNYGSISGSYIYNDGLNSDFSCTITASETDNFTAASVEFVFGKFINNTVNSGVKLSGSDKYDYIYNTKATVTIDSGAGDDYTENLGNKVSINAGEGNDSIYNYADSVTINAGVGDDYIANSSNNKVSINAGAGNDTIANHGDTVTIAAGEGNDSIDNWGRNVTINAGAGNDSIQIKYDNNSIRAGTGDDLISLDQGATANTIFYTAGDGNDLIQGFNATSTLSIVGGSYSTQASGADVLVVVGNDTITLQNALLVTDTIRINSDVITPLAKSASLSNGNDNVTVSRSYISVDAGEGNDTVSVSSGYVSIYGGAGDDSIYNKGYGSTINGGLGGDSIWNNANTVLFTYTAGDGNDLIQGFNATSTLSIVGGSYSTQASGADVLVVVGNDTITLQNALLVTDTIRINSDVITPLAKSASLSNGNDNVTVSRGYISVDAGEGNDTVSVSSGYVSIYGGAGDDSIYNKGSNVTIEGGAGADYISNSGSNVLFKYTAGDGNDLIKGFNATSTLSIVGSTFTTTKSGNNVIVNVGNDYITIQGGATVSPLNIVAT